MSVGVRRFYQASATVMLGFVVYGYAVFVPHANAAVRLREMPSISQTLQSQPSPQPLTATTSGDTPSDQVVTPISSDPTSALVTKVTLLMVSFGGVVTACTPLILGYVRAKRKGAGGLGEDDEDLRRQAEAMALALLMVKAQEGLKPAEAKITSSDEDGSK